MSIVPSTGAGGQSTPCPAKPASRSEIPNPNATAVMAAVLRVFGGRK